MIMQRPWYEILKNCMDRGNKENIGKYCTFEYRGVFIIGVITDISSNDIVEVRDLNSKIFKIGYPTDVIIQSFEILENNMLDTCATNIYQ